MVFAMELFYFFLARRYPIKGILFRGSRRVFHDISIFSQNFIYMKIIVFKIIQILLFSHVQERLLLFSCM